MASPNLSELVTTTLRNRTGQLADNVTENNAILMRLKERGKIKPVSGGRTIVQELEYAENGTAQWYSGYEVLDITPSDVMSAAEFDFKQLAVTVSISGLEQLQNAGKERIIDLLEARISNAEKTMQNFIATGMYAAGTGSGGKEIGGLQLLVADTPTSGIVGGINRATASNAFWRNKSTTTTALSATTIQSLMNRLYVDLVRGTDKPDLILADSTAWVFYLSSLQSNQRFTNSKMAEAGFENLKFMGADVVLDGGYGGACPSQHMYFLNTNYVHYRPHRDRNMVVADARQSVNQDALVQMILWAGNMTLSNAFLQGVIRDS